MKILLTIIYLCVLVVQECRGYFYPPVFWHHQNCVFRQLKESYGKNASQEFFMKVLPYNGLNIVCPNLFTVNDWLGAIFPDGMHENMWMVDKHGFDNCVVNDQVNPSVNKLILKCDDPNKIKYEIFKFHNKYNQEEPMFAPGYHYYFISTSSGDIEDLDKKSGGHCKSTKMKLHIYVCDPKKEDCVWEIPQCDIPYKMRKLMTSYSWSLPAPTRAPVTLPPTNTIQTTSESQDNIAAYGKPSAQVLTKEIPLASQSPQLKTVKHTQCANEEENSVHMILNFVLGGVILFMAIVIIILACGLARKSNDLKNRPSSVAFSALSHEPNVHLYEETGRYVHPPLTPLSRPTTPLTNNPPFYLPPMSEIHARSPNSKSYGFNNPRRHSYDGSTTQAETTTMITDTTNDHNMNGANVL